MSVSVFWKFFVLWAWILISSLWSRRDGFILIFNLTFLHFVCLLLLLHVLHDIITDPHNINTLPWIPNGLSQAVGLVRLHLVIVLRVNLSYVLQIFIKLQLRFVNSLCKRIRLLHHIFEFTVRILLLCLGHRRLPPRMVLQLIPGTSLNGVFIQD